MERKSKKITSSIVQEDNKFKARLESVVQSGNGNKQAMNNVLLNPDINFSLTSKRHNSKFAHVKSNMEQFVKIPFLQILTFLENRLFFTNIL